MEKINEREVKMSHDEIIDSYALLTKIGGGKKDKFALCMGKLAQQYDKKMKKFNKDVDDIDLELSSVDASGDVKVNTQGTFVFSKENYKKRMEKINELKDKQVTINITKTPDLRRVKTLPINIILAFDGILYDLNEDFWNEEEETKAASNGAAKEELSAAEN